MFFSTSVVVGQNAFVALAGGVKEGRKNLEGVKISVTKEGRSDRTLSTPITGKFAFRLELNTMYVVEFSKPGYVTKRVSFNTNAPQPESESWNFEFLVDLFQDVEGLDKAIFVNPVAKVEFNEKFKEFDYDLDYSMEFQKAEEQVFKRLEQISKDKLEAERRAEIAQAERLALEDKLRQAAQENALAEAKRLEQERLAAAAKAKAAEEERIRKEQQALAAKAAEEQAAKAKAAEEEQKRKAAEAKAAEEERIRKEQQALARGESRGGGTYPQGAAGTCRESGRGTGREGQGRRGGSKT